MEPSNAAEHYSEKLVRLANLGISCPWQRIPAAVKTRADFCWQNDAVVYLCCQTPCKYLPQHDRNFAEIARRVDRTQFVFISRANPEIDQLFQKRWRRALPAAVWIAGIFG